MKVEFVSKRMAFVDELKKDKQFANNKRKYLHMSKSFLLAVFRWIVIIGVSYVILSPLIGMLSNSLFSDSDRLNPMVYIIPMNPTLGNYDLALKRLNYLPTMLQTMGYSLSLMLIQILICSMVGYGFARFDFPFKKLLFGCVVIMIVVPSDSIMLPLYTTFMDFFGHNILQSATPMYLMTIFGCGLRSGLYIYIFNQFFRGLPKEIEEAAFVDGAGAFYTYFRIMLVNAAPSIITVSIFSMVWQYNDLFFSKLFLIPDKISISKKIVTLTSTLSNMDKILDPNLQQIYFFAGVLAVIAPVLIIYIVLQRFFMEGVERSGIVG